MYLIYVYIDIVLRSLLYDDDFWQMLTIKTYNITVVFEIYSCGSGLEDVCEIFVSWSSVGVELLSPNPNRKNLPHHCNVSEANIMPSDFYDY